MDPLRGRRSECASIDRLLDLARLGQSGTLIVRGAAGIGKSALLDYAVRAGRGFRVIRGSGVESEMELAYAGLHLLSGPIADGVGQLPPPQRAALSTAFGLSAGPPPERFLVVLASLSLLSYAARDRPLLCVVDDVHWFDAESTHVLAFVARRLQADAVALLLAKRPVPEPDDFAGLPDLRLDGLSAADAREVLKSVTRVALDAAVEDRIVAETAGNPLALLELPRGLTPAELAGGFGVPTDQGLSGRIEERFERQIQALPDETQRLLLVASAEPIGDPALIWAAAGRLGISPGAATPAIDAGLVAFDTHVRFRHPLVRSAIYQSGPPEERRRIHAALADATDAELDPDRKAWHRVAATAVPDEAVAMDLERSASRAQARGGPAAAAAFLARATSLTVEPRRRSVRALRAAFAKQEAGAPEAAVELLAIATAGPLDELERARAHLLRAQVALVNRRSCTSPLLLQAAGRLGSLDPVLARTTYLDALFAILAQGHLADRTSRLDAIEAARAAQSLGVPEDGGDVPGLFLDGFVTLVLDSFTNAAPKLHRAMEEFRASDPDTQLCVAWVASYVAALLWDSEWDAQCSLWVDQARRAGAVSTLPLALSWSSTARVFAGDLASAESLLDEMENISLAINNGENPISPYGRVAIAAWRGHEAETVRLSAEGAVDARARGEGLFLMFGEWATALVCNALGRYEDALRAARRASKDPHEGNMVSIWGLVELIEAATRTGNPHLAADALHRVVEHTSASRSDWAFGIAAYSRALLSTGTEAEDLYRKGNDLLRRGGVAVYLARGHLLFGEWLRREGRRLEAREQLGAAHQLCSEIGLEGFAARARRELAATGARARKRTVEKIVQLTAQESQIAHLAGDGLSNPEIAARLFISPRTVEYHLGKVFSKLAITSRGQLSRALADDVRVSG
jgi:DNA-binding CsgD family transcriptional regulator